MTVKLEQQHLKQKHFLLKEIQLARGHPVQKHCSFRDLSFYFLSSRRRWNLSNLLKMTQFHKNARDVRQRCKVCVALDTCSFLFCGSSR